MSKKWFLAAIGGLAMMTALAVSLALVLPGSSAQDTGVQTALASPSSGGPSEGIKVHGHWIIEVRDPDGTLVSRREFDNALSGGGGRILANILGRENSAGRWRIRLLGSTSANQACLDASGGVASCEIGEPNDPFGDPTNPAFEPHLFTNLTLAAPGDSTGPGLNKLTLTGNATAQRDGVISRVLTGLSLCPSDTAPDSCAVDFTAFFFTFTATVLATPESVVAGQQILATVELTFS